MPLYVVVAALAVASSIPLLWFTAGSARVSNGRVSRNLTAGLAEGGDLRRLVLSQSPSQRLLRPFLGAFASNARRISPAGMAASLERRVEIAGVRWPLERVFVVKLGLGVAMGAAGLVWALVQGSLPSVLVAVLASAIGYFLPDSVLARKARARQLAITHSLPDTLDQLTICVEAGLGFDAALARTTQSGRGPLAEEIARTLQELRMGVPRAEALDNLVQRTEVPELRQFVHALTQAEVYGVPVAGMLRAQAAEQREKRRFKAEEEAMKLPVKVIFPLIFCILPSMFVVILGPAAMNLVRGLR